MEWLIVIAVIALGVPAWAWFAQERMIFFPQPVASSAPAASPRRWRSSPTARIFAAGSSKLTAALRLR
jgi:hypothetical protein